jgi:hypothetical protein
MWRAEAEIGKISLRDLAGGQHESRKGVKNSIGSVGIAFCGWRLSLGDVGTERLASK